MNLQLLHNIRSQLHVCNVEVELEIVNNCIVFPA